MFRTKFTDLLNIEYPIMQGGMHHIATPKLAAAVSNAGGLGTINAMIYEDLDAFRAAIQETKALTDRPFCVNISMFPKAKLGELVDDYFRIIAEEKVAAVETSGRNPAAYIPLMHEAGVKVIHKVASYGHAEKVRNIGLDALSIIGLECGGHPGMDEVGTIVLGRKVAKNFDLPLLIGGGIADGAGFAAALALGADGITMGTRFIATQECVIHRNFKDWIVSANETETVLIQRSIRNMLRAMVNTASLKCLEMEAQGAPINELMSVISGDIGHKCQMEGNLGGGIFAVGQAIGLIDSIPTVQTVMSEIIAEAQEIIHNLGKISNTCK